PGGSDNASGTPNNILVCDAAADCGTTPTMLIPHAGLAYGLDKSDWGQQHGVMKIDPVTNRLYVAEAGGVIEEVDISNDPSDPTVNKTVGFVTLPAGAGNVGDMIVDSDRNKVYAYAEAEDPLRMYAVAGNFASSPSVTEIPLYANGVSTESEIPGYRQNMQA